MSNAVESTTEVEVSVLFELMKYIQKNPKMLDFADIPEEDKAQMKEALENLKPEDLETAEEEEEKKPTGA